MSRTPGFLGISKLRWTKGLAIAVFGFGAFLTVQTAEASKPGDCIPSKIDEDWLIAMETDGGHTLDRHVSRTPVELSERLKREPRIPAASSFKDRKIATRALSLLLLPEETDLDGWADYAGRGERAQLRMGFKEPIGVTVQRGNATAVPAYNMIAVLMANGDGSCVLLTAYPTK
jgi:hypothetical protein